MSNSTVIKVTPATISKMKKHYQKQLKSKTPPYAEFSAKVGNLTITAYTFWKQSCSKGLTQSRKRLFGGMLARHQLKKQPHLLVLYQKTLLLGQPLAVDEVGNGSYFGPVVVCATYVEKSKMPLLKELGVKNSKELTDQQIQAIAKDVRQAVPYRELIVNPTKYNQFNRSIMLTG